MGRASVKPAFHSVWGSGEFVCPGLTAETISQLSPKDWQVFSLHLQPPVLWKPLSHSQANQRQPPPSQALHSSSSPFGTCSTPEPPGILSPTSPAHRHTSEQLCFAFPPGCTLRAPLLSLCRPGASPTLGYTTASRDGRWERGWKAVGSPALPEILLQPADGSWCSSTLCST